MASKHLAGHAELNRCDYLIEQGGGQVELLVHLCADDQPGVYKVLDGKAPIGS